MCSGKFAKQHLTRSCGPLRCSCTDHAHKQSCCVLNPLCTQQGFVLDEQHMPPTNTLFAAVVLPAEPAALCCTHAILCVLWLQQHFVLNEQHMPPTSTVAAVVLSAEPAALLQSHGPTDCTPAIPCVLCMQQRFVLDEQHIPPRIRAAQGHSIILSDPLLAPVTDAASVPVAVHATSQDSWQAIQAAGELRRMNRWACFTHLSRGRQEIRPFPQLSGSRCEPRGHPHRCRTPGRQSPHQHC